MATMTREKERASVTPEKKRAATSPVRFRAWGGGGAASGGGRRRRRRGLERGREREEKGAVRVDHQLVGKR
jgi:hypothetical protein